VSAVAGDQPLGSKPPVIAFGLIALAAWLTLHLYWGIQHDAVLYTMQGLAHLHPELYSNDIFFKYGSQDRYSAFGAIYAGLIGLLGVDHAAAVLTLISQLALLYAAWHLARRLMPDDMALLAVALLAVLDLPYGTGGVFSVVEDFATPRALAEALVLGAMAAAVVGSALVAMAFLLAASLIHPLMALGGFVWLGALHWPRHKASMSLLALLLLALFAVGAWWLQPPPAVRTVWMNLAINRAPYLVLSNWSAVAWSNLSRPVATLCVLAVIARNEPVRQISVATLAVAALGLIATFVGGDWLRIVLALQAQPWRWNWIAVAVSTLMLPWVVVRLAGTGTLGRAALALLLTVYFFQDEVYAPLIALLAVVAAWLSITDSVAVQPRAQKLIFGGALSLLLIGIAWDTANRFVYAKIPYIGFADLPNLTLLRRITRGTFFPAVLLMACWWIAFRQRSVLAVRIMLVFGTFAALAALMIAVLRLSIVTYPSAIYAAFSPWRTLIPRGAEVLWAGNPLNTWIYLERPSFFSDQQLSTTLFSQTAASVMRKRLLDLEPFLASAGAIMSTTDFSAQPLTLEGLCSRAGIEYVVTHRKFAAEPLATLDPDLPRPYRGLKLFRCGDATLQ
jgi:hypothetical protein